MFPFFPYSNFHRLNADWILKKVQELATAVEGIAANVGTWAARIQQTETNAANALETANDARDSASAATQTANSANTVAHTAQQAANQAQATANHADVIAGNAVSYAVSQNLDPLQQARGRQNIGAASPSDIPDVANVVRTSVQTFSENQKLQARINIGAEEKIYTFLVGKDELDNWEVYGNLADAYDADKVMVTLESLTLTVTVPAMVSISGNTVTTVSATIPEFNSDGSAEPNTFTRIYITNNGGTPQVTVSTFTQRQVPVPTPRADGGKLLEAQDNGRLAWENRSVHITCTATGPTNGTWTFTDTGTWSDILNAVSSGKVITAIFPALNVTFNVTVNGPTSNGSIQQVTTNVILSAGSAVTINILDNGTYNLTSV